MTRTRRLTLALAATLGLAPAMAFAADDHVDASLHAGSVNAQLSTHADKVDVDIAPYPGAHRIAKDDDGDNGAFMLSLMSGAKGVKLELAKFATTDSPEKVLAFYQRELAKRGPVTRCDAKSAKSDACSDGVHSRDDDSTIELKVGTKNNQRVVAVTPKPNGTELVLLRLELPGVDD